MKQRDSKPTTPNGTQQTKEASSDRSSEETISDLQAELEEKLASLTATNRQLKRKIFDLYTVFEISRNFNAVLDYRQLLDTFILTSMAQVGASKAAMFLREDGRDERLVMVSRRGSGQFPAPDESIAVEARLSNYLCRLNRPALTEELLGDIADDAGKRVLNCFHPGLVVPIVYKSTLRGMFFISEKMSNRDFQNDDIEFLSILGNQISVAIENARLYEAERMATQQLRSTQEQLVQAERLAALGEMSAKVAHEINNPLGIIKNYLLLLRRAAGEKSEAIGYCEIVGQEIDRIAGIVRQLLDFHRPDGVVFKTLQVSDVIEDVLRLMKGQIAKGGAHVKREFQENCPPIMGSEESLKQVFMNLIFNALDAMGKAGGTLRVSVRAEAGTIVLQFADTGPGIDPSDVPHIFEPFYTTKDSGDGTGLGLSVCYGIMKNHKGSISYKRNREESVFEIVLPTADGYRASE